MHGQVVQCCLPWQLLKLIPFAKCPAMCSLTIHNLCASFFRAIRTKKSSFLNRYMRLLGIFRSWNSSVSSNEELIYPISREIFRVFLLRLTNFTLHYIPSWSGNFIFESWSTTEKKEHFHCLLSGHLKIIQPTVMGLSLTVNFKFVISKFCLKGQNYIFNDISNWS